MGPFEHQLAQRGGAGTGAVTEEQRAAQRPFDPLELGAESGLGDPQKPGRLVETSRLGDGPNGLEMPQLQIHDRNVRSAGPDGNPLRAPGRERQGGQRKTGAPGV